MVRAASWRSRQETKRAASAAWLAEYLQRQERLPYLRRTLAWFLEGKPLYVEPTDAELVERMEAGFRAAAGEVVTEAASG